MKPQDLVARLIADAGETPTSIAKKTRPRIVQSTLHRYLTAETSEARRSSLQPLAVYLGIPVDALYDPKMAAEVASLKGYGTGAYVAREPLPRQPRPANLDDALERVLEELGTLLAAVPPNQRKAVSDNLAGYALDGGAHHWRVALSALLRAASTRKRMNAV